MNTFQYNIHLPFGVRPHWCGRKLCMHKMHLFVCQCATETLIEYVFTTHGQLLTKRVLNQTIFNQVSTSNYIIYYFIDYN